MLPNVPYLTTFLSFTNYLFYVFLLLFMLLHWINLLPEFKKSSHRQIFGDIQREGDLEGLNSLNAEGKIALKTTKLANNSLQTKYFTKLFNMLSSISHTEFPVQVLRQLFFIVIFFTLGKKENIQILNFFYNLRSRNRKKYYVNDFRSSLPVKVETKLGFTAKGVNILRFIYIMWL